MRLAWRNTRRNTRRTLLTVSAVTIAVAALIFALSYVDGILANMLDTYARTESGHVRVRAEGYSERERSLPLHLNVPAVAEVVSKVRTQEGVEAALPRIRTTVLVDGAESNQPGLLLGLGADSDTATGAVLLALGALGVGLVLGLTAGFGPQWLDNGFLLLFDGVRAFPVIIFGLATVTLLGPSLWTVIFVVAVTSIPIYARIVRTQTQAMKNNEFIVAERAMGAGTPRILGVHVLPNVIGPLLILASMDVPLVITTEAGLSFLGMGVRPPTPSWGTILNDGYNYIRNSPWPVIAGGIPIVITTLGFTFLGEALRDIFDPKLRKDL